MQICDDGKARGESRSTRRCTSMPVIARCSSDDRMSFIEWDKLPVAYRVHFHAGRPIRRVDQPAIGSAAVLEIERYRRETYAVITFPLVNAAISVRVLFDSNKRALLVILKPARLAVAPRRNLDAGHGTRRIDNRPSVLLAIVCPRNTHPVELLIGPVVFPSINLAIAVPIDLNPNDCGTIHIAVSLKLTVPV